MKKQLLTLLAIGSMAGAYAASPADLLVNSNSDSPITKNVKSLKYEGGLKTRADENYSFSYCAGITTAIGVNPGFSIEAAIEIPAEYAKNWVGNKITSIEVGFGQATNTSVLVYVTKDLQGEPVVMKETQVEELNAWNVIELDTPYVIDGSTFYVGYQTITQGSSAQYPIGVDFLYTENPYGSWIGLNNEFFTSGDRFGHNAIRFNMEGQVKPDYATYFEQLYPEQIVAINKPFETTFTLLNLGAETITDIEFTCTVGEETMTDMTAEVISFDGSAGIPFGTLGVVNFTGTLKEVLGYNLPLTVKISAIKGKSGSQPVDYTFTGKLNVLPKVFDKNIVVEEYTGTGCGWCPRGIVGMDTMKELYGGKGFIGITVHTNYFGTDPMTLAGYQNAASYFTGGALPNSMIQRVQATDPNIESLESYYLDMVNEPAIVGVDIIADYDSENEVLHTVSTAEFVADEQNASYAFIVVVLQDHVGPAYQNNYYAGGAYGPMDGWESKGSRVETYYDMVARYVNNDFGVNGSVPSTITANVPVVYNLDITLEDIKKGIQNSTKPEVVMEDCYVVAMLVNTKTGEILNAAQNNINGVSGVNTIAPEEEGIIRVYNPQGMKVLETTNADEVQNLKKGIYIINGKKVLVK